MIVVDEVDDSGNSKLRKIDDSGLIEELAEIVVTVKLKDGTDQSVRTMGQSFEREVQLLAGNLVEIVSSYAETLGGSAAIEVAKARFPKSAEEAE